MASTGPSRLAAILAFIAAALAATAAGIRYAKDGELKWTLLAAALVFIYIGWTSLKGSKSPPPPK